MPNDDDAPMMTAVPDDPFVELNRRFRRLEGSSASEDRAYESYTAEILRFSDSDSGLDWDELLRNHLAVILGEPGSGKTWEFQRRADLLAATGKYAVFVPLEGLTTRPLADVLDSAKRQQFDVWKRSENEGFFFADSVDEAKFQRISDFLSALDRLRDAIAGDIKRAQVFLSCRISEWRPETDAHEVLRRFRQPKTARHKHGKSGSAVDIPLNGESLLVVQIEPLDKKRVQLFATARGTADTEQFIEALDRQYAWEFARRPIDVVDLLNYWVAKKQLGSLSQLLEFSTERKLRPVERDLTDPLSPARARSGVEALGAANLLCRLVNFGVPDAAALTENALDVRACLPTDWRSEEVRSLLTRAIFDAASYGRIRFHHRRVGEYLAAAWLGERMRNGCTTTVLEELLFDVSGTKPLLRPTLAPVAAWLCLGREPWNQTVREWIATRAPHIHLRYGDPQTLPIDYRRKILAEIVRQFVGRNHVWLESSRESLSRLAHSELASDFSKIIEDQTISEDIRTDMLRAVEHGRVTDCLGSALRVIRSPNESERMKIYAAAVIRRLGDDETRRKLAEIAADSESVPSSLLGIVCQAIYPSVISSDALVALLRKARPIKRFGVDLPYYLTSHFQAELSPQQAGSLLASLLELIQTPPYTDERPGRTSISRAFGWVAKLLPTVLEVLLKKMSLSNSEAENAATALRLLGHMVNHGQLTFLDDEKIKMLDAATTNHPSVRQKYAWQRIVLHRQRKNSDGLEFFQLSDHYALLQFTGADLKWLLNDIVDRTDADERVLAMRLAMQFLNLSADRRRDHQRLRQAAGSDRRVLAEYRSTRRGQLLFGIRRLWYLRVKNKLGSRWWWIMRWHTVSARSQHLRDQWRLLVGIRLIRSGKAIHWLSHLMMEAGDQNSSRWTAESWDGLRKKRGRRITDATRHGCKMAWRRFVPRLPHEKSEPNQTDIRVGIGLTGIQVDLDDGELDFKSMSRDDAMLAARYAVNELNGFPAWFYDLAQAQPEAARSVLRQCAAGEWQFAADRERPHEVMNKLVWQGQLLNDLICSDVLELLRDRDPGNFTILRCAVGIALQASQETTEELIRTSVERLSSLKPGDMTFALWIAVLLQLDASRALPLMETVLGGAEKAKDAMVAVAALLSPRGSDEKILVANPSYASAGSLRRLIPLVFEYVRPGEDLDRSGTTYSPEARDYAEEFRQGLIPRLGGDTSSEAQTALNELLDEPSLVENREWLMHLIDKQAATAADGPSWTPADIREFASTHEIDPKTDRDLYRIACKRLVELKNDVERSENSLRDDLREGDPEMKLRRWLARRLNERSRQRYTVPEEAVIDLEQRPDLKIQNPNTRTISVEVKWADDGSTNELLERLQNQVFGQYLRAHTSEYAIYVIAVAKYRHWHSPAGDRDIDFEELTELLGRRANELAQSRDDVGGVTVIGINFRQPK